MKIIYPINVSAEYARRYKIWFAQEERRLAKLDSLFRRFGRKKGDILHAPFLFASATYQEKNESYSEFESRIVGEKKNDLWKLFLDTYKVIDKDNLKVVNQLQILKDAGVTTAYLENEIVLDKSHCRCKHMYETLGGNIVLFNGVCGFAAECGAL